MPEPTYYVGIEFVSGSYTNITEDVLRVGINRSLSNPIETLRPGDASLLLDNFSGKYSPGNAASAYAGMMRPQLQVKIEASYAAESFQLFRGFIDEWSPTPNMSAPRTCTLQCRDNVKKLYNQSVSTSLFINYNVGSAFASILSESTVQSYFVDIISDQQPFIWFRDIQFTGAMDELIKEGFFFAYAGGDGVFNVRDRYFDLEQAVVASLSEFTNLTYTLNDDQVYNEILVEGVPRIADASVRTIATIANPIYIPASSQATFFLEYIDPDNAEPCPAIDQVTPVNSTDYQLFVNSDGTGTQYTSTASASVTFFGQTALNIVNNGTGTAAWLTRYGIRGKPIHRKSRITSRASDSSSQAIYGDRTFRISSDLLGNDLHNNSYTQYLLDRYKNPVADVAAAITNKFPDVLAIDLADKIVMIDSITGISSQYIVQSISHDIDMIEGLRHQLSMDVYKFRDSSVLILDDATYGVLDSRKLGF